jgi:hypothetical protein
MSRTSLMKALSMLGAASAVSLMLANAASAYTVKTTKTFDDGFGDRVTKSRTVSDDGFGDRVTTNRIVSDDRFGDRVSKSRTVSDNGFDRCVTVRRSASDAFGDRNSRSFRTCRPDF